MGFKKVNEKINQADPSLNVTEVSEVKLDENGNPITVTSEIKDVAEEVYDPSKTNEEEEEVVEEEVLVEGDSEKELAEKIKVKQDEFNKFTKKLKISNYIVTGVILLVLIGALVIALTLGNGDEDNSNSWITIVVMVFAILLLVASFFFSRYQKKKLEVEGNKYLAYVLTEQNKVIYDETYFKDLTYKLSEDKKDTYIASHQFKDIKAFKSINIVNATLLKDGREFLAFDCAASILLRKNRPQPHFLGRMFIVPLTSVSEDFKALFQLKGGELSFPVDDIDDLKLVEGNNKFTLYSNSDDVKKIFNTKLINTIKRLRIDKTIIDVIVSINESNLYIGIDYADEFINVPTKDSYNTNIVLKSKEDIKKVLEIIDLIK